MIKQETIKGNVFVSQIKYYIYRNEEDLKNDRYFLTTSDKKMFDEYKMKIKNGEIKL